MPTLRSLMEQAYSILLEGGTPIVVAPTGYGKTAASRVYAERVVKDGLAGGLIHVAPLRSLVRRIFLDHFREIGGSYQMHEAVADAVEAKSPYFLSSPVVTTMDSYLWNLYRIPVLEYVNIERGISMGHYYPALMAIYSSLNVFDEAHLYLSDEHGRYSRGGGVEAVKAATYTIARLGVPLMIETATMKISLIVELYRLLKDAGARPRIVVLGSTSESYIKLLSEKLGGKDLAVLEDEEWIEANTLEWHTRIYNSWSEALPDVLKAASDGRVLLVSNTVAGAVSLYRELRRRVGGELKITLIHGRLSERDRRRAEEEIYCSDVVVSTQVVEAGVDVNSVAVFSEAAPLEDLIQRAGRACRRGRELEYCKNNGAFIGIVRVESNIYDEKLVAASMNILERTLKKGAVDWRIPRSKGSILSYTTLLAQLESEYRSQSRTGFNIRVGGESSIMRLFRGYLASDAQPWVLLEILDRVGLCGLFRDTVLVNVYVGEDDAVLLGLNQALSMMNVLETVGGAPIIRVKAGNRVADAPAKRLHSYLQRGGGSGHACNVLYRRLKQDIVDAAKRLGEAVSRISWGFVSKPEAYVQGIGLIGGGK